LSHNTNKMFKSRYKSFIKELTFQALLLLCMSMVLTIHSSWQKDDPVVLKGAGLNLQWKRNAKGWHLAKIAVKGKESWINMPVPDGCYTVLYSDVQPDTTQAIFYKDGKKINFPESVYRYPSVLWKEVTKPVQMNTAGQVWSFYPNHMTREKNGLSFSEEGKAAALKAFWQIDPNYPGDIQVKLVLTAKKDGYFSMASPTVTAIPQEQLAWGLIPGYFQGASLEKDFIKAYAYGQGIPDQPVLVRERAASTLSPLISLKNGTTIAVIPEPGTGRDPWAKDKNTHKDWLLGMSLMNRSSQLSPTAYHPILGEKGSFLKAGDTISFSFRYTIRSEGWYPVFKHAVNDVYHFKDFLSLKQTQQSLTERVLAMHKYVADHQTSMWRTESYKGLTIGAQAYLGGVLGADKDAMKNSDYGAMWMLSRIMNDSVLLKQRLPFARNFKLLQQQEEPGFFQGAAVGQYFLSKKKKFTEEWGPYVEPIGLTYYTMMDIGNILLFEPGDNQLKARLRQGAERLLQWQRPDGGWAVAYDRASENQMFTELEDLRPTFYGLVVAYRILGDQRYLDAACKGADWYIKNAVEKGHFLGVCGDARFVPDFATVQSAQALMDLYDLSKKETYLNSAVQTARFYTTSIYTHPIPNKEIKTVKGIRREDWEISQVGLSFEHGGSIGSANSLGPILLASHAGLFVRIFQLTKDSIYLDMARAAVLGRDAFVDPKTNVASYYWQAMNSGPGSFPHHAWWQIGWITDYLLSEAEMRSQGGISFPRGFITPKVGPHESYGFAPGQVYGIPASLILSDGMLKADSPYLDYAEAINRDQKKCFLILMNSSDQILKTQVHFDPEKIPGVQVTGIKKAVFMKSQEQLSAKGSWTVEIGPYCLRVIEINY
jgi:hypothetical protein